MTHQKPENNQYASSPCYAHEFAEANPAPHDKQQVKQWRKQERQRLLRLRMQDLERIQSSTPTLIAELEQLIDLRPGLIVSVYWPMRGEFDLRDWYAQLIEKQVRIALPVMEIKSAPMVFREWTPDARMEPGIWNILAPVDGEQVTPDVIIVPLVGFDSECYRLGHGGGYYDRTLGSLSEKPFTIGVGSSLGKIATIYPQPHDIPMDAVATGLGQALRR